MDKQKQSYGEMTVRLNEIAETMEKGQPDLETMVSLFEEGMDIIKKCEGELNAAAERVRVLTEAGEPIPWEGEYDV